MSQRIVSQHQQGVLSVSSEGMGRGAAFTMTIGAFEQAKPFCGETEADMTECHSGTCAVVSPTSLTPVPALRTPQEKTTLSTLAAQPSLSLPARVVVVVDDSSLVRKMSVSAFRRSMSSTPGQSKVVFVECEDGSDVVELVRKDLDGPQSIHLILMDNIMTNMHGIEATRRIRQLGYSRALVALSGNVLKDDQLAFITAGADRFLSKPMDHGELGALLAQVLAKDSLVAGTELGALLSAES